MAFAYYYGQMPLSPQAFGPLFNISPSTLVSLSRHIPDYVRELLVEDTEGVRPAHYVISGGNTRARTWP